MGSESRARRHAGSLGSLIISGGRCADCGLLCTQVNPPAPAGILAAALARACVCRRVYFCGSHTQRARGGTFCAREARSARRPSLRGCRIQASKSKLVVQTTIRNHGSTSTRGSCRRLRPKKYGCGGERPRVSGRPARRLLLRGRDRAVLEVVCSSVADASKRRMTPSQSPGERSATKEIFESRTCTDLSRLFRAAEDTTALLLLRIFCSPRGFHSKPRG